MIYDLPGHGFSLHRWVLEFVDPSTVQLSPPCSGIGLSHSRVLIWSAPPHVTEHIGGSQFLQLPQPPLTNKSNLSVYTDINYVAIIQIYFINLPNPPW